MNYLRILLITGFSTFIFPVFAQQGEDPGSEPPTRNQYPRNSNQDGSYNSRGKMWFENARRRDEWLKKRSPPQITPAGWLDDYDYRTNLGEYLQAKHQKALSNGKDIYIYLYADWYEPCKAFRKSIRGEDYDQLFSSNEIIMLDYSFFNMEFDAQIERPPLFVKVHDNYRLGPESFSPLTDWKEHPRKAYYKLRDFLQPNQEAH